MPDLHTRAKHEQKLAALLMRANNKHRKELEDALGFPPDPSRVPPSLLAKTEEEINTAALALLLLIYIAAFDNMGKQTNRSEPMRDIAERNADRWAADRAGEVSRQWRENTQSGLSGLANSETPTDVSNRLDTLLGKSRAETIATTETTTAISAGESDFGGQILDITGEVMFATWQTERDSRVCPICSPLHNKPQTDWHDDFASGPPAHPNCRCYLIYELLTIEEFEKKTGEQWN